MTQNVDPKEIQKFTSIASRWWDPESSFKPLHQLNPLRVDFIQKNCNTSDKTILDIGCGGGILTESLAKLGAALTGIDLGQENINIAKLHSLESNLEINYRTISIESLAEENTTQFDIITCMEMLEHVPDPKSIIQACSKLLKPKGKLFLSTINRNPKAFLQAIVGAEYILGLLPKGTHEFKKFIKPSELANWARPYSLKPIDMTGITYNPLNQHYKLTTDTSVNYLICFEN